MAAELGLNHRCREEPDAGVLRSHPNKTIEARANKYSKTLFLSIQTLYSCSKR